MSDLKSFSITGPDGFTATYHNLYTEDEALYVLSRSTLLPNRITLLRQAGYRAEPIEEPKMVTVRAEDVAAVTGAKPASFREIQHASIRLRAALDGAK